MALDDSFTKLLLHMDGSNNGTMFTDEAGKTITVTGNTCTKTDHCLRDVTKAKTYYASSSYNSSNLPGNAFNDDLSTGWHSLNSANNEWIAVDLGAGNTCVFDALSFIPTSYNGNAHVKDFTIYGSNDSTNGSDGSWTQIGTGTHVNSSTWQLFNFTNSVAYRWAKVVCNTSYRSDFIGGAIIEMEIGTADNNFGTAAAYFDGSGDILTVASSADFAFGTGDFTVDMLIYVPSWGSSNPVLFAVSTTGGFQFGKRENTTNWGACNWGVAWGVCSTTLPTTNTWHHIAAVRASGLMKIYLDGVQVASGTDTNNYVQGVAVIGTNNLNAYIDELRVSKGIARWTSNFTPPTMQYTPAAYKTSGTAVFGPLQLPEMIADPQSSSIDWTEDVPTGTTVSIKAAIFDTMPQESDYQPVTNGGAIPGIAQASSGKNLYIKAYLSTTDTTKTPKLLTLAYGVIEASDTTKVKLTLTDVGRMKYPAGDVTVLYAKANGNLTGELGGQVDDFAQSFSPTNIYAVFNPNDIERVSADLSVASNLMRIYYGNYQSEIEHIRAELIVTSTLYHINDIPT